MRERVAGSRMNERRTDINQMYFQRTGVSSVIAETERNRTIVRIIAALSAEAPPNAVFYQNTAVEDEPYVA